MTTPLASLLKEKGYHGAEVSYAASGALIEFPNDQFHPPILLLHGSYEEMGITRGTLMAKFLDSRVGGELTPMYATAGGWNLLSGQIPSQEQIEQGRKNLFSISEKKFLPAIESQAPEFLIELKALYKALHDLGNPLQWEDLLIMNCGPENTTLNNMKAVHCSNFAAWSKATASGKLYRGDNLDLLHFGFIPKSVVITIVQPPVGHSYLQIGYYPMIVGSSYLNDQGFNYGENTSHSTDYQFPQIPHLMHACKCALEVSTNFEAKKLLEYYGGTTGWNHLLCDSISPINQRSIVIEQSGTKITLREYDPSFPYVIWSTNFFNCYPGWQGYNGINMIPDQLKYWQIHPEYLQICGMDTSPMEWKDLDTMKKWRQRIQCPRYERYRELLTQLYGTITPEIAQQIQSDPGLTTKLSKGPLVLTPPMNGLFGFYGSLQFNITFSVYSAIFCPEDRQVWVAAGANLAQQGSYWPVNLNHMLELIKSL